MKKFMNEQHFQMWVAMLILGVCVVAAFYVFQHIGVVLGWIGTFVHVIMPFIAGFMIAYVLNIPREAIEKLLGKVKYNFVKKRKRGFSVALTYLALIVIVVLASILIFPHVISGIVQFVGFLPHLFEDIQYFLLGLDDDIPFNIAGLLEDVDLSGLLYNFNIDIIGEAFGTIVDSLVAGFRVLLALISSVYFLAEAKRLRKFAKRLMLVFMSKRVIYGFLKYGRSINTHFKLYIRCQVLDALILGTLATIVMTPLTQYAFALGPIMTVANLIPYFGALLSTALAIVVILIENGLEIGFLAAVLLIALQQLDANFIFPRLLGGTMKISPLLVIVSISIGNFYYGILGMIIAIPIAAVAKNVVNDILKYYEIKRNIRREVNDERE